MSDRPDVPSSEGPDRAYVARDSGVAFLKDNLEAIAVAVVMALVIKHFCVEAFKIPTSSMKPTLMGKDDNGGEGDRILVDKWSYLASAPERWDVIVFKYPLNTARNFIKRIALLPDEHGHISEDGDLWVRPRGEDGGEDDLRIPEKPRRVREQFYRIVYPAEDEDEDDEEGDPENPFVRPVSRYWAADEGDPNAWRLESLGRFVYTGGRTSSVHNRNNILEHTDPDSWATSHNAGELVRDARFRLGVTPEAPALAAGEEAAPPAAEPTRLSLRWRPDERYLVVMTLASAEGRSEVFIRRDTEVVARADLPARLVPGRRTDLELEYVDGRVYAHVDGTRLALLHDGRRFEETRDGPAEQRFQLEAEGGALTVEDLRIDRDLRYDNSWDGNAAARRGGLTVPADSYFMLGDNTGNSSDSRRWRLQTRRLIDGRLIRYDYGAKIDWLDKDPGSKRTPKQVVDVDGLVRRWYEEDEDPDGSEIVAAPFVHRDLIVGRAFLVFWPWTPTFPGRVGFIH